MRQSEKCVDFDWFADGCRVTLVEPVAHAVLLCDGLTADGFIAGLLVHYGSSEEICCSLKYGNA